MFNYFCFSASIYHINSEEKPMFWDDFVIKIGTFLPIKKGVLSQIRYTTYNSIIIYWAPNLIKTFLNYILNNKIIYLCWGISESHDRFSYLKSLRLYLVLKLSNNILVNDRITQKYISDKFKITSKIIPYFVDTNFYSFKKRNVAKMGLIDILIVGDNGRDEEFILQLDSLGHKIFRVTTSDVVKIFYEANNPKNINILYKIDYIDLRKLYQTCDVFLMPIRDVNHAAGQTALLEAISTGCPIIVSDCISATIFQDYQTVFVLPKNNIETFNELLLKTQDFVKNKSYLLEESSLKIKNALQPETISKIMFEGISGN